MADEVGIGLVGYGGIGRVHALCYRMLPLLYPQLPRPRICAVASGSASSAERASRELGDLLATTDIAQLLALPDVDIVDCCAPTGDHHPIAIAALDAGKALYCEKPLTANQELSQALVTHARQQGRAAGVHFHFRSIPALQEAQRRIAAGLLGDIIGFQMRYYRSSNLRRDRPITWRSAGPGSGVLVDLGSHLIDLTHYLLGPITSVAAQTRTLVRERPDATGQLVPVEADDDARLSLTLAGGALGTLVASKVVAGAADDIRIEAYGTHGSFSFDTRDPNTLLFADGPGAPTGGQQSVMLNRATPAPSIPGPETPTATLLWHTAAIAGFLAAYSGAVPPPITLADGLRVDHVIEAALHSARTGGVPVALPVDEP